MANSWCKTRLIIWFMLGGVALWSEPSLASTEHETILSAHRLYQQRRFIKASKLLKVLLPQLRQQTDLRDAYLILGACSLLSKDQSSAEQHFEMALSYDRQYQPDPLLFAPDVQAFIRHLAIQRRTSIEKIASSRQRADGPEPVITKQSFNRASRPATAWYVALLPFGLAQFANHQSHKGWIVLGLEGLLASTSATCLAVALGLRRDNGKYSKEAASTARGLNVTYLVTAYAALATMVYGAIDGLMNRRGDPVVRVTPLAGDRLGELHLGLTARGAF